jgi:hypothetical protein
MIASTPFPTAVQMVVVARRMSTSTTMKSPVVRMSWNSPGEKQTSTSLFSCKAVTLSCRQNTAMHVNWPGGTLQCIRDVVVMTTLVNPTRQLSSSRNELRRLVDTDLSA